MTNSKLTDETLSAWKMEAKISLGETAKDARDYSHHEAILALVTELQERRKADSEPAAWKAVHHSEEMDDEVIFSTRQALDAFLARAGWWPALTEIKPPYAAPQPVPVVPDEWTIQDAVKFCRETGRQDAGSAMEAWNACRAAMLQGVEQPQNARQNIPENIPDGNSPAIPDDWVMVPRVPTTEMANAMIGVDGCSTSELLVALKLAIAAAPQQEAE